MNYDKHYLTENLFGEPFPALIQYFENQTKGGLVLDLGCGQGRDAIPVARLGFEVVGIDQSEVGITQMKRIAETEGLHLEGIVGDFYAFEDFDQFDYIILDSLFHFTKKDKANEIQFISTILRDVKNGAEVLFFIQNTGVKVNTLKGVISDNQKNQITFEDDLEYVYKDDNTGHSSRTPYKMIVFQKILK